MTSQTPPNIVFFVLDTCRADVFYHLLDDGRLPGIGRIVSEARVYRNATAVAPWTVPSHGSMFSGLYPADHGTSADDPYFDPPTPPLAERLHEGGYETIGLSANPWIAPHFDFTIGFDRFKTDNEMFWGGTDLSGIGKLDSLQEQLVEVLNRTSLDNALKTFVNASYQKFFANRKDSGAARLTTDAIKWLTKRSSDAPFFLFCNFTEPHLEYNPPTAFVEEELPEGVDEETARSVNQDQWAYIVGNVDMTEQDFEILKALYRAEIRYLDTQLGRLFEKLAVKDLLEDTAIILVSDHGENIGDHGLMDHQFCLYETLLNVPLIIRYPPRIDRGETNALIETHRLYETVADLAGIEETKSETAPSLVNTDEPAEYAIAEYTAPQPSVETLEAEYGPLREEIWRYNRALRSIRSESGWKYIEGSDGSRNLYNLRSDPNETTPVKKNDVQKELRNLLERCRGDLHQPSGDYADIDSANEQQLRDLGYL